MSELWRNLICIPLMLSNSPQSPEQSIVHCSSETSHAPPMADISLITQECPCITFYSCWWNIWQIVSLFCVSFFFSFFGLRIGDSLKFSYNLLPSCFIFPLISIVQHIYLFCVTFLNIFRLFLNLWQSFNVVQNKAYISII